MVATKEHRQALREVLRLIEAGKSNEAGTLLASIIVRMK
jgi:hypothetical protein